MDDAIRKIINTTTSADFDGHSEFAKMTPDQRLSWLDAANAAYLDFYALAKPELRAVAEESPEYKTSGE